MSKTALRLEAFGTLVALVILLQGSNSGALRYYLTTAGLPTLYNIPDFLAIGLTGLAIAIGILARNTFFDRKSCFLFAGLLLMGALVGYMNTKSFVSVAVTFKVVCVFLMGYFYSGSVRNLNRYWIILLVAYAAQAIAIYIDQFSDLPWKGFVYETLGQTKVASRQWWAGGQERIAGLSSDSTAAALSLIVIQYLIFSRNQKFRIFNLAMHAATIYLVYLTTSKTALACAIILAAKDLIVLFLSRPVQSAFYRYSTNLLLILIVAIPALSVTLLTSAPDVALLNSWYDRATRTWLAPLELMWQISPISFLTGMGMGMVGYPISYSSMAELYIPYDNFLLGCAMMFGVPFAVLVFWQMLVKVRILPDNDKFFFAVLGLYGVFIAGFGSPLFAVIIGSFYGFRRLQEGAPSATARTDAVPPRPREPLPLRPRPPLEPRRPQG